MTTLDFLESLLPSQPRRRRGVSVVPRYSTETLEVRVLPAAGISILRDILPGNGRSLYSGGIGHESFVEFNGLRYFGADSGSTGYELWRTDGTEAGTEMFLELRPGAGSGAPSAFHVANGKLFFVATNSAGARSLFATDGTVDGTIQLAAAGVGIALGTIDTITYYYKPGLMATSGEFWRTDGTVQGTRKMSAGFADGGFGSSVIFDGTIFLSGDSISQPRVLYRIDSTTDSVVEISGTPVSIGEFREVGSLLFFSAAESAGGPLKLWKMTSASATPEAVQTSGTAVDSPQFLTSVNNTLYFSGRTTAEGHELWKSDGTSSGTVLVKDIQAGSSGSGVQWLTAVGSTLYFSATDTTHGQELWKSDGTPGGTVLVKDIASGAAHGSPSGLADVGGSLFFVAVNPSSGNPNAWLSDGSPAGTQPIDSTVVLLPENLRRIAATTFLFSAENNTFGREPFLLTSGTQLATPTIAASPATTNVQRPALTWNSVTDATRYEVWVRNTSTNISPYIRTTVTTNTFTPTADLGIGNFTIWVRAHGSVGTLPSAWSSPRNLAVISSPVLNPVETDQATGFPEISWPALKGASMYEIWVDRIDVPTSHINGLTTVSSSRYVAQFPNGRYQIWVRGIATDGLKGSWSSGRTYNSVQVPGLTGGTNPTFDHTPTITWTNVPGATTYEVYVLNLKTSARALHQQRIAGTAFTWPALTPSRYRYWVRVTGSTVWSRPVDISTDGRTTVLGPINSAVGNRPEITWRKVDGATQYRIWANHVGVRDQAISQTVAADSNATSIERFVPSALSPGSYRLWIQAIGPYTASWSVPVDFVIG